MYLIELDLSSLTNSDGIVKFQHKYLNPNDNQFGGDIPTKLSNSLENFYIETNNKLIYVFKIL